MSDTIKHWHLYVLLLEEQKYYVGITSQTPEERFHEHLHGRKSYWTQKYKPIKILQTEDLGNITMRRAEAFENKVTRRYMREYGVNNVRGGDLTTLNPYVVRFGYIFYADMWETFVTIVVLTIINLTLTVMLILKL